MIFISILEWISKIVDGLYKVFFRTSKCKFRYLRNIYWLIWIKSEKFHPYIADFTPWTINIDIIFTISIITETNTNLMTKFGHKHRTLNTSEWISSTTKNRRKTRATRLATDWRMLSQGNFWTKAEPPDASRVPGLLLLLPGKRRE